MKEEKKKRDAFYFIHTEATVDTHAHWDDLQCGVIIDDSEEDNTAILSILKTQKANHIKSSSSSEKEMFPPDDLHIVDNAAANAYGAASALLHSPLINKQLDSEYRSRNVEYVEDVEHLEHLGDSHVLNFDVIFYNLNKLDSSAELIDVKTRLLKLKDSIVEESVSLLLDDDSKDFEGGEVNDTQKENFEIDEQIKQESKNGDMTGVAEDTKPEGDVGTISNLISNPEVPVVNPSSVQDDVLGAILNPILNTHASAVDPTSNMIMTQTEVSKLMILDQFSQPTYISLPAQSMFMVQNAAQEGNFFLALVGGNLGFFFQNPGIPNPVKPDGVATPHEPSSPAAIQNGENANPGFPAKPGVGDGSPNPGGMQNYVLVGAKPVVPEDWSIANLTLAANLGIVNEPSNPAGIQNGENVNPGFPAKPGAGVGDGSPNPGGVPVGASVLNETPAANPTIANESQNPPGVQNAAKPDVANASPRPGDDVVNTIRNDAEEMKNDNDDDAKCGVPDISNGTPVVGDETPSIPLGDETPLIPDPDKLKSDNEPKNECPDRSLKENDKDVIQKPVDGNETANLDIANPANDALNNQPEKLKKENHKGLKNDIEGVSEQEKEMKGSSDESATAKDKELNGIVKAENAAKSDEHVEKVKMESA